MFRIDPSPPALPYPTAYSAPRLSLFNGAPFLTSPERIGLPQVDSAGTRARALGQLPPSYPETYRYHTVSTPQPWGTPPTPLTSPYRYNSGNPYHKSPYVYPQNRIGLTHFPRGNYCELPQEPKPTQSYIGLIAIAILSAPDKKLVLSDIYKYILDHYPYFRSRGPGWRNSIRHNLSLNECFIKSNRSANGKGHFWAVHPANVEDFTKGDFRRRRAQRKVRKYINQKRTQSEMEPQTEVVVEEKEISIVDVSDENEEDGCDIDNVCNWDNDSEVDVLSTQNGEEITEKPAQRRGAFDMDTILSTYFPCVRKTGLDITSTNEVKEVLLTPNGGLKLCS